MSFQVDFHELSAIIQRRRSAAITTYNSLAQQLEIAVNKGTRPTLLNAKKPAGVSEIEQIIQKMNTLKKQIFAMNSALLNHGYGEYGVCVKTGKLIPKEWPGALSSLGFEEVEAKE
jgi:hypothetical protein